MYIFSQFRLAKPCYFLADPVEHPHVVGPQVGEGGEGRQLLLGTAAGHVTLGAAHGAADRRHRAVRQGAHRKGKGHHVPEQENDKMNCTILVL